RAPPAGTVAPRTKAGSARHRAAPEARAMGRALSAPANPAGSVRRSGPSARRARLRDAVVATRPREDDRAHRPCSGVSDALLRASPPPAPGVRARRPQPKHAALALARGVARPRAVAARRAPDSPAP